MVLLAGIAIASAVQVNVVTVTEEEVVTVTKYVTSHQYRSTFITSTTTTTTVESPAAVEPAPPSDPTPDPEPAPQPAPEQHPPPQQQEQPPPAKSSAPEPQPSSDPAPPSNQAPGPMPNVPGPNDPTFSGYVLQIINAYRKQHNANPLSYDASLATIAAGAAATCKAQHTKAGENIYGWTGSMAPDFTSITKGAIDSWMDEASGYSGDGSAGHFTQCVWKGSQRIGCSWSQQKCSDGYYYFFCEFDPVGNFIGNYPQNVS
ncbi:MAG: hypothetical protein M1839_001436 [Geoglossum umbratile]|nr:MAG: hypothetical protein M1839_001436 [Geoglossum umbratile]